MKAYTVTMADLRLLADVVCLLDGFRAGEPEAGRLVEVGHRIIRRALGADVDKVYSEEKEEA